jgi:hypothetical protein
VAAPDFHMYGLAKMFADSYMLSLARHVCSNMLLLAAC